MREDTLDDKENGHDIQEGRESDTEVKNAASEHSSRATSAEPESHDLPSTNLHSQQKVQVRRGDASEDEENHDHGQRGRRSEEEDMEDIAWGAKSVASSSSGEDVCFFIALVTTTN